ncbi:hypothetical protein Bca52824_031720 [Brassica carinata]|uniref:Translation initiation factor 5A C-terminal domain-containing protein n=1 Tax=Brassica carinata TaxID=52824 RepID=A0A8X7R1F5_BRACI|nr:hypothetical protein Bca52824_060433 [Brassica carinata]KAG2303069.1 hypothetical protein Bca52824_031720 [Brassica carinata]
MSDEELESTNVKDSKSYPQEAGTIRKNDYIVIKGHSLSVYRWLRRQLRKLANATSLQSISSLPSSSRISFCLPTTVPRVNCTDYTLLYIFDDGFVSVLTENGTTKDDLKLPTDEALLTQVTFLSHV